MGPKVSRKTPMISSVGECLPDIAVLLCLGRRSNHEQKCKETETETETGRMMNQTLRKAMQRSDDFVIEMDYADAKGNRTHRVVSPIRFMGSRRFLGLCLCREQPRQFQLSRCKNLKLIPADRVLMPVPMS